MWELFRFIDQSMGVSNAFHELHALTDQYRMI